MGPSGCGKSTLLHLCGAMDRPDRGRILLGGTDLARLGDDQLTLVRRRADRLRLPVLQPAADPDPGREHRAAAAARRRRDRPRPPARPGRSATGSACPTGSTPIRRRSRAGRCSARPSPAPSSTNRPCSSPTNPQAISTTGNGTRVLDLLTELNASLSLTILLATHAPEIAAAAHRTLHMRDGVFDEPDRLGTGTGADGVSMPLFDRSSSASCGRRSSARRSPSSAWPPASPSSWRFA